MSTPVYILRKPGKKAGDPFTYFTEHGYDFVPDLSVATRYRTYESAAYSFANLTYSDRDRYGSARIVRLVSKRRAP